jgi:CheY-like chemotaxis protein
MSILVVDDSPDSVALMVSLLNSAGHMEIRTAGSAREGFALLEGAGPPGEAVDLILLDIQMPDMMGIDVCRWIKAMERLQDIPIIMVTASTETESVVEAFDAGALDYITKPVRRTELLARVRSALNLRHQMEARRAREEELARSNQALREALHEIRTLRGLIPICASCKKIRSDAGLWQQIEVYLHEHTEAEFSHGLCPDCIDSLYPDVRKKSRASDQPGSRPEASGAPR